MLYTCVPYFRWANTLLRRATVYKRIEFNRLGVTRNMGSDREWEESDVAKIEEVVDHPVELFRIWHKETRRYNATAPDACCLATTSKDCKVSARNVILREFDNDGFTIVTDNRSKKIDNVENIPYAAMCFLWVYVNDRDENITKQVRIEGAMRRLESEQYKHLYDREPLFCKIRSHVCDQGRVVDWDDLKRRHDEVLDSVRRGENDLPMPDHFVGYKLFPTMMEFYYARDCLIGDRVLYRKDSTNDAWESHRISA